MAAPWENGCPARMPDSRILKSPVRALNTEEVVASLITDQAAIEVTGQLGGLLSDSVRPFKPDAIIGRPTLGVSLAPLVAHRLGHSKVARLFLDPNQMPLLHGKKAMIVDDAASSGTTLGTSWNFLAGLGCGIVGCGVVVRQGGRWQGVLGEERARKVVLVFECPLLRRVEGGWDVRKRSDVRLGVGSQSREGVQLESVGWPQLTRAFQQRISV
ncbi:unnamed protein product [Diplocarpon coronariae]